MTCTQNIATSSDAVGAISSAETLMFMLQTSGNQFNSESINEQTRFVDKANGLVKPMSYLDGTVAVLTGIIGGLSPLLFIGAGSAIEGGKYIHIAKSLFVGGLSLMDGGAKITSSALSGDIQIKDDAASSANNNAKSAQSSSNRLSQDNSIFGQEAGKIISETGQALMVSPVNQRA